MIVNEAPCTPSSNGIQKVSDCSLIVIAKSSRVTREPTGGFHAFESKRPFVLKIDLLIIHHLQHQDLMFSASQHLQTAKQIFAIKKEV